MSKSLKLPLLAAATFLVVASVFARPVAGLWNSPDETANAFWAERVAAWTAAHQHVYVYFDNDAQGRAPHDAARLIELVTDGR